jgi:hypothetical protein
MTKDSASFEFLAPAVLLDYHVRNFVDALVSGKALSAFQTLTAAANGIGFLALARIHHLVILKSAKWTFHGAACLSAVPDWAPDTRRMRRGQAIRRSDELKL